MGPKWDTAAAMEAEMADSEEMSPCKWWRNGVSSWSKDLRSWAVTLQPCAGEMLDFEREV